MAAAEEEDVMETFKYGDLEITVDPLQVNDIWQEYGIKIQAPGHPVYAFKAWYHARALKRLIAHVVVYDLIEAYSDPMKFLKKHSDPTFGPMELVSLEEDREFIRAADALYEFLHAAYIDVWIHSSRSILPNFERGPREWMPSKKKV